MSGQPVRADGELTRAAEPFFDLRHYAAILRRRRRWFLGVAMITLGVAVIAWLVRTPTYVSSSQILVKPVAVDPRPVAASQFSLETEAAIVRSTEVARLAADDMGVDGRPDRLVGQVSVDIPQDTQALDISFTASDPAVARRGAQSFAEAYLAFKAEQIRGEIDRVTEAYDREIRRLKRELAQASETLASSQGGSDEAQTAATLQSLFGEQIATLSAQRVLVSTTDVEPGEIIVRAAHPRAAEGPGLPVVGVLGSLLGLFLGVMAAFVRERIGDPLTGRADIERCVGAPVLAVIPRVPGWRNGRPPVLATVSRPASGAAEAYRTLRAALLARGRSRGKHSGSGPRSILMVSPLAGEGKTTTTANVSVVLAQAGHRVLAVSADLRRPRLHEFFRSANRRGLPMVLRGQPLQRHARRVSRIADLWFLPSGPPPALPSEMIRPEDVRHLLVEAGQDFDHVIIDCPPLLPVADSRVLASVVGGVLLVVDPEESGRAVLSQAAGELRRMGANVIGVVMNNVDPAKAGLEYVAHEYTASGPRRSRVAADGQVSGRVAPRVRSR